MLRRIGAYARQQHLAILCLCLVIGGGTAWALANNTVKSKHIVNGQVKNRDLADNAVDSAKVEDASLQSEDLAAGEIPAPVAFAQVDAGDAALADLDPNTRSGIEDFSHTLNSFYCFDLVDAAKAGVASPRYDGGARVPRVDVPGSAFCPATEQDASVVFANTTQTSVDQGFHVAFFR